MATECISVVDREISPFLEDFIFTKLRMRSFAKINARENFRIYSSRKESVSCMLNLRLLLFAISTK